MGYQGRVQGRECGPSGRCVDDRIIDHFMGHQTEEMRRRYQHLFPEERRKALSQLGY